MNIKWQVIKTVHLACATLAMYNTLIKSENTKEEATDLIYKIGWKIYTRMGEILCRLVV